MVKYIGFLYIFVFFFFRIKAFLDKFVDWLYLYGLLVVANLVWRLPIYIG